MVILMFPQLAPYRTDPKSETLWTTSFDGKPLTIQILFDFFMKAHKEGFTTRSIKKNVLGSIQPVTQSLLHYLAKASQVCALEDLLFDHHKEGSHAWVSRQLENFNKKNAEFVDLKQEKRAMGIETILGTNVEPFKFVEIEVIGDQAIVFIFYFLISPECYSGPQSEREVKTAVQLLAQLRPKETLTESRVEKMKAEQLRFELKKRGLKTPRDGKDQLNDKGKKKRIGLDDHKLTLKNWIMGERDRQDMADKLMRERITLRMRQFSEINGCKKAEVACWDRQMYLEARRNSSIQKYEDNNDERKLSERAIQLFNLVSERFRECSGEQIENMITGYEEIGTARQPNYVKYEEDLEDHGIIVFQKQSVMIRLPKSGVYYFSSCSFLVLFADVFIFLQRKNVLHVKKRIQSWLLC